MNLDYIEIGTSDFETLAQTLPEHLYGLSIEPIKTYLDRLPDRQNSQKINLAVSDTDRICHIYSVDPEDIVAHSLPDFVKGCNSIDKPHPGLSDYLNGIGLLHLHKPNQIECISFETLVARYDIQSVKYLKVDTEGHDFTILRSMLRTNLRPEKVRFEANSIYTTQEIDSIVEELQSNGYKLIQRDSLDVVMRYQPKTSEIKPVLVISTGRRLEYLTKTIRSLFDWNRDINESFKSVWILDDRSSAEERYHVEKMMGSYFGCNYQTVNFNNDGHMRFVDKFNFISKITDVNDVVFFLEDDWECAGKIDLEYHTQRLIENDWTQIAFGDPLNIQEDWLIQKHWYDFEYWNNPFPDYFRHPHGWDNMICFWNLCRSNNYTNNPSLTKASIFHEIEFVYEKNFEAIFADSKQRKQMFTNECIFKHFGTNSLINQIPN